MPMKVIDLTADAEAILGACPNSTNLMTKAQILTSITRKTEIDEELNDWEQEHPVSHVYDTMENSKSLCTTRLQV